MPRRTGFRECKFKGGVHVRIKDEELIEKLVEYARKKDMNLTQVVEKLIRCKENIDGLIENLERETYELLDEDQKIDVILELQKQLKQRISGGREDA